MFSFDEKPRNLGGFGRCWESMDFLVLNEWMSGISYYCLQKWQSSWCIRIWGFCFEFIVKCMYIHSYEMTNCWEHMKCGNVATLGYIYICLCIFICDIWWNCIGKENGNCDWIGEIVRKILLMEYYYFALIYMYIYIALVFLLLHSCKFWVGIWKHLHWERNVVKWNYLNV